MPGSRATRAEAAGAAAVPHRGAVCVPRVCIEVHVPACPREEGDAACQRSMLNSMLLLRVQTHTAAPRPRESSARARWSARMRSHRRCARRRHREHELAAFHELGVVHRHARHGRPVPRDAGHIHVGWALPQRADAKRAAAADRDSHVGEERRAEHVGRRALRNNIKLHARTSNISQGHRSGIQRQYQCTEH